MGAAGAIEGLFCALSVKNDVIPPNVNLEVIDPEIDKKINLVGSLVGLKSNLKAMRH